MTNKNKKRTQVETDLNVRWEQGTPHHPKSVALFKALAEIDWKYGDDSFGWKSGGDGDNGEMLMYEMDIYFDQCDAGDRKSLI